MYSLIIPVYKNAESLIPLLAALEDMNAKLENQLQVVFVVDGSPDTSYAILKENLPRVSFASKLILLSRNFGAWPAFRTGVEVAEGKYFTVMSADLQEPPELILDIFAALKTDDADIVFSVRNNRQDPWLPKMLAKTYWYLYKKFIQNEMPAGGVDVFGCNAKFREQLLQLRELNSSFVGLACWLGFRRKFIGYTRLERQHGKSAWKLTKKIKYAMDSAFAFSDLPIKLLYWIGFTGIVISLLAACAVLLARLFGIIQIPGYSATMTVIVFFAALNLMGLGIIGSYVWRAFENTKFRPHSVIMSELNFDGIQKIFQESA